VCSDIDGWVGTTAVMISITAFGGVWSPVQTLTLETYPTVIR